MRTNRHYYNQNRYRQWKQNRYKKYREELELEDWYKNKKKFCGCKEVYLKIEKLGYTYVSGTAYFLYPRVGWKTDYKFIRLPEFLEKFNKITPEEAAIVVVAKL